MTQSVVVAVPGIGGSLLSTLACPLCWPMYAGVLAAFGVGGVTYSTLALPLGIGFLALAVASLWHRASERRGYRPLLLGAAGAGLLLAGELVAASEAVTFSGVGVLIVASVWNAWPCRVCVQRGRR